MGDGKVRLIVHDVCQIERFTNTQRKNGVDRGNIEKLFYKNMEEYSDTPVELAVLAGGIGSCPEMVEYIKERPLWRACCHGMRHIRYDCIPENECREELQTAKNMIEDAFGVKVTVYVPPFNGYNEMTRRVTEDLGMEEVRKYRKFSNYFDNIDKCAQYDYHYWDWRNVNGLKTIFKHKVMKPPVVIVGAPRSGTTAYMRYMALQMPDYLPLKEHESFWAKSGQRRLGRLRAYYAKQLIETPKVGIIDKNVRNTFRVLVIQKVYPEARFIFVYRNPRAAISSWRDWAVKTRKKDTSIKSAALQYFNYVKYWLENRDMLNNWKEERYEHLCDTEDYFVSRDYKWQKRLTASDLKIIDEIVKPIRKEIGYE